MFVQLHFCYYVYHFGQRNSSKMIGAGAVAAQHWSEFEEIPHVQGQRRSPNKMVEVVKSHLESNPTPNRNAEGSNKPCMHQDPETPQRLRLNCLSVSCGDMVQQWIATGVHTQGAPDMGMAGYSILGYGISPLGGGRH